MKNSFNSRLFKSALLISVLGLTILLGVIISGAAYPELLFRVGAPIGMLCCFVGAFLIIITYICEIFCGIREKQFLWVTVLLILGGFWIIHTFYRS